MKSHDISSASITCWICLRPLALGTDGNGRTTADCPPCRAEIEAMQAQLERLTPRRRPCPTCRKGRLVARQRVCRACKEAAETARAAEAQRAAQERAAAIAARKEDERLARLTVCACGQPFEKRGRATSCRECRARKAMPHEQACVDCHRPYLRAAGSEGNCCPACRKVARSKGLRAKGLRTRARLQEVRREHPDWSTKQIADVLGVSTARVYQLSPVGQGRKAA